MSEIPHTDNWKEHHPTTTFRGQQRYPVPEDWVLSVVEMDGIRWKRYDDIGHGYSLDSEIKEARNFSKNAADPDEVASLGREPAVKPVEVDGSYEHKPVADPADQELSLGAETIFRVYDPIDTDQLWAATAVILARHSRDEEYDGIVDAIDEWIDPTDDDTNKPLGDWKNP